MMCVYFASWVFCTFPCFSVHCLRGTAVHRLANTFTQYHQDDCLKRTTKTWERNTGHGQIFGNEFALTRGYGTSLRFPSLHVSGWLDLQTTSCYSNKQTYLTFERLSRINDILQSSHCVYPPPMTTSYCHLFIKHTMKQYRSLGCKSILSISSLPQR